MKRIVFFAACISAVINGYAQNDKIARRVPLVTAVGYHLIHGVELRCNGGMVPLAHIS